MLVIVLLTSSILASDVAYITKKNRDVDKTFLGVFNELGLETDIIFSKNIRGADFSDYKFIFIGDGRLKNTEYIPVNEVPSVITTPYYGKTFDILIKRRISKLASNTKLSIRNREGLVQVYTQPRFKFRGLGLPLYYLSDRYKSSSMESIAVPFINSRKNFGGVISYSNSGPNKCFFGITKTEYWTPEARELFKDCVEFVLEGDVEVIPEPECYDNSDCGEVDVGLSCDGDDLVERTTTPTCGEGVCSDVITETNSYCEFGCENDGCLEEPEPLDLGENHDVALVDFNNAVDNIFLEYKNGTDILDVKPVLNCGDVIKAKVKVENQGDYNESVSFNAFVNGINFSLNDIDNLISGATTYRTSITPYINLSLSSGFYNITVEAIIDDDVDLSDNIAQREVQIIC